MFYKVIGQSRIWNSVKHQRRRSYSSKVCGAPLDDWANGGYVDGLLSGVACWCWCKFIGKLVHGLLKIYGLVCCIISKKMKEGRKMKEEYKRTMFLKMSLTNEFYKRQLAHIFFERLFSQNIKKVNKKQKLFLNR